MESEIKTSMSIDASIAHPIESCRISGSKNLIDILDLGDQPLANAFEAELKQLPNFPLQIAFCPESSLLQLKHTIEKGKLFDHYLWTTGGSKGAKEYAKEFANRVVQRLGLSSQDLVVEIASNDGTLLKAFQKKGLEKVCGVDPAVNVAALAEQSGVPTRVAYWSPKIAQDIQSSLGDIKVVIARNVVPHVDDTEEMMRGFLQAMDGDGVGIIEFHDAKHILEELHYDSIYHEHLCYFSIKSITHLLNRFGFKPFHIDASPISGGSHVIYFSLKENVSTQEYEAAISVEEESGVNTIEMWQRFAQRCLAHQKDSQSIMKSIKDKCVVGFGASARSTTYLNFCGFNASDLKVVIDNSELKQGRFTPGSQIPIVSLVDGLKLQPDIIWILAWNFKDEVIAQCRAAGFDGQFITAFPNGVCTYEGKV